jgi:peptidyl-prolyl cis-trans isomerase C
MNYMSINDYLSFKRVLRAVLLFVLVVTGLSACGSKDKVAGQAVVRVNGEEITILQLNDEQKRAGDKEGKQLVDTKQLLESLINRQLLTEEGQRLNIDRTPDVLQAIERAKAQIISDAYLESIISRLPQPSQTEIEGYYQEHPEYFSQRKQYDMQQLIVATKDLSNDLKNIIGSAKTLDEVASWLDKRNVHYARGQLSRNTTDMPEQIVANLKEIKPGQLFIVTQRGNSLINSIVDIRNSFVNLEDAAPQIKRYLINKKSKDAVDAEVARLRSLANIEYLNVPLPAAK